MRREVEELQAWYERHWEEAEDVTPDILRASSNATPANTRPLRSMPRDGCLLSAHELSVSEWERSNRAMYPVLDHYQREGYHSLMQIGPAYNGALLCDGVGSGQDLYRTDGHRAAALRAQAGGVVRAQGRAGRRVGEQSCAAICRERGDSNLVIYNHTDLLRGGDYPELMQEDRRRSRRDRDRRGAPFPQHRRRTVEAEAVRDLSSGKQLFLLTATPINNSLYDLMHLIELLLPRRSQATSQGALGIHTLRGHFRQWRARSRIPSSTG